MISEKVKARFMKKGENHLTRSNSLRKNKTKFSPLPKILFN